MGRKTFSAPVFITAGGSQATILETSSAAGAIPVVSDIDSNPSSPGPTRTKVIDSSPDIVSQNVGGLKVAIGPFITQNLATNQATVAMNLAGVANSTDAAVPYAGSVLAFTFALQTHLTAGGASALTAWPTKNTTTIAALKVVFGTAAGVLTKTVTQNKDTTALVAGDRIGVKVLTVASMAPTTNDPVAVVFVDQ